MKKNLLTVTKTILPSILESLPSGPVKTAFVCNWKMEKWGFHFFEVWMNSVQKAAQFCLKVWGRGSRRQSRTVDQKERIQFVRQYFMKNLWFFVKIEDMVSEGWVRSGTKLRIDVGQSRSHGFFKIIYPKYYNHSNEYTYIVL